MTDQLDLATGGGTLPNRYSAAELAAILGRYRLPISNEAEMQAAIVKAFVAEMVPFDRERTRGKDRIDFYVCPTGIECKVKGSVSEVTRQLERYAQWDEILELLVVSTRGHHLELPTQINGKRVRVHIVRGMF